MDVSPVNLLPPSSKTAPTSLRSLETSVNQPPANLLACDLLSTSEALTGTDRATASGPFAPSLCVATASAYKSNVERTTDQRSCYSRPNDATIGSNNEGQPPEKTSLHGAAGDVSAAVTTTSETWPRQNQPCAAATTTAELTAAFSSSGNHEAQKAIAAPEPEAVVPQPEVSGFLVKNEVVADRECVVSSGANHFSVSHHQLVAQQALSPMSSSHLSSSGPLTAVTTPSSQLVGTSVASPSLPSHTECSSSSMGLQQQSQQQQHHHVTTHQQTSTLHSSCPSSSSHPVVPPTHLRSTPHPHLLTHLHLQQQQQHQAASHHLFTSTELAVAAAAAASSVVNGAGGSGDPRQHHHLHYGGNALPTSMMVPDCMSAQNAVAFLAGPRERIHVLGNPVEHCPRCQQEGLGAAGWRPHRHIGELKIRYICERHFDDLDSNHHFDIPLCPICNQVLYLYDFNNMLGVSNARRLHKYVLKCANRHVLPLLDLFCQTKKGGERCNANFKLQWCYGTMVKRCEAQKNRDHDLWWVRYKNEWKQRRTIIRYKKDFLSHLTDAQRSLLLGLGLEGEPPPDPKAALGPTFDALVSTVGGSPGGPKIKKRTLERANHMVGRLSGLENVGGYDGNPAKQRFRPSSTPSGDYNNMSMSEYSAAAAAAVAAATNRTVHLGNSNNGSRTEQGNAADAAHRDELAGDPLRYVMGAVLVPSRTNSEDPSNQLMTVYLGQQQQHQAGEPSYHTTATNAGVFPKGSDSTAEGSSSTGGRGGLTIVPSHAIITGTPTPPLPSNGVSPVAVSVVGDVINAQVVA